MLESIRDFITNLTNDPKPTRQFEEDDQRLAFAALLAHAMAVDGTIDDSEKGVLRNVLIREYGLTNDDVDTLVNEAINAGENAIDLYSFTSVLTRHMAHKDRVRVVERLWEIVYADGEVHEFEDNMVWRVAELLGVERQDRLASKAAVAERFATSGQVIETDAGEGEA